MNAQTNHSVFNVAASVADIVSGMTRERGQTHHWMQLGRELAVLCGMRDSDASFLRAHELQAIYQVACKSADAAARFVALKWYPQAATPMPPVAPVQAPLDIDAAIKAALASVTADMLASAARTATDASRDAVASTLASIPAMVAEAVAALQPRAVTVHAPSKPPVTIQNVHMIFDRVLMYASQRQHVYLMGPAGSGKTTLAKQIATALGLPFYMASKVATESDLLGYTQPHDGTVLWRMFRHAYQNGGVFLLDEADDSAPKAMNALNAALANGKCPFPDGMIDRHPDFICIAGGNTNGLGPCKTYVTRGKLDGAFRDRFAFIEVQYDLQLERNLAPNADYCRYIQALRVVAKDQDPTLVVSPRATIDGGRLINCGESWEKVTEAFVWKFGNPEKCKQLLKLVPFADYQTSIL